MDTKLERVASTGMEMHFFYLEEQMEIEGIGN